MFSLRILVAVCIVITSKSECEGMNFYEDIMDKNLDVRQFLGNDKMVHIYAKCLIEDGPCPAMAVRLRKMMPRLMANKCLGFTQREKELKEEIFQYLQEKKPETYKALTRKFLPNSTHEGDGQQN